MKIRFQGAGRAPFSARFVSLALAVVPAAFPATATAVECASTGTAPQALPNDAGQGHALACGDTALTAAANSVALGKSAVVGLSGDQGVAIGHGAFVDGTGGLALGVDSESLGNGSVALGREASVTEAQSIAIGWTAQVNGQDGIAIGKLAQVDQDDGIAFGSQVRAHGVRSVAIGKLANAMGDDSTVLGTWSSASGNAGVAVGYGARANATAGTALGYRAFAEQPNTVILGSIDGVNAATVNADTGIGTISPLAPLHIRREDETQTLLYLESDEVGGPQDRAMIYLVNNGGSRFEFHDVNQPTGWRFQAQTGGRDRFEITKVGTGEIEFDFRPNGNLYVAGTLFTNSDVNTKQDILPVPGDAVLEKLGSLPISEWSYRDATGVRHLGPMAQDFHAAFGLGPNETTITATDMAGVSLAAVKALEARNRSLEARVAQLEAILGDTQ